MKTRLHAFSIRIGLALLVIATCTGGLGAEQSKRASADESRWQDRLERVDRALLDELIGYAPPAIPADVRWMGSTPLTWEMLRGKVVVVQSWSNGSTAGRRMPQRLEKSMAEFDAENVQAILLHVPEGVATLDKYIERKPAPYPMIVDADGGFSDALGIYKRPVNILIDRNGTVRYAGLNARGLPEALSKLIAEPHDPAVKPKPRETKEPEATATYPEITGDIRGALDLRGRKAPNMAVEEWMNGRPNANGKVVIVDFWATWCGPCVASIPHMNSLATTFRNEVVIVGLSDESLGDFRDGMEKLERNKNLSIESFRYAVALDPSKRMMNSVRVTGIPHALVMSSDWVVRWQGHPARLNEKTLDQIVRANRQSLQGAQELPRNRWTRK